MTEGLVKIRDPLALPLFESTAYLGRSEANKDIGEDQSWAVGDAMTRAMSTLRTNTDIVIRQGNAQLLPPSDDEYTPSRKRKGVSMNPGGEDDGYGEGPYQEGCRDDDGEGAEGYDETQESPLHGDEYLRSALRSCSDELRRPVVAPAPKPKAVTQRTGTGRGRGAGGQRGSRDAAPEQPRRFPSSVSSSLLSSDPAPKRGTHTRSLVQPSDVAPASATLPTAPGQVRREPYFQAMRGDSDEEARFTVLGPPKEEKERMRDPKGIAREENLGTGDPAEEGGRADALCNNKRQQPGQDGISQAQTSTRAGGRPKAPPSTNEKRMAPTLPSSSPSPSPSGIISSALQNGAPKIARPKSSQAAYPGTQRPSPGAPVPKPKTASPAPTRAPAPGDNHGNRGSTALPLFPKNAPKTSPSQRPKTGGPSAVPRAESDQTIRPYIPPHAEPKRPPGAPRPHPPQGHPAKHPGASRPGGPPQPPLHRGGPLSAKTQPSKNRPPQQAVPQSKQVGSAVPQRPRPPVGGGSQAHTAKRPPLPPQSAKRPPGPTAGSGALFPRAPPAQWPKSPSGRTVNPVGPHGTKAPAPKRRRPRKIRSEGEVYDIGESTNDDPERDALEEGEYALLPNAYVYDDFLARDDEEEEGGEDDSEDSYDEDDDYELEGADAEDEEDLEALQEEAKSFIHGSSGSGSDDQSSEDPMDEDETQDPDALHEGEGGEDDHGQEDIPEEEGEGQEEEQKEEEPEAPEPPKPARPVAKAVVPRPPQPKRPPGATPPPPPPAQRVVKRSVPPPEDTEEREQGSPNKRPRTEGAPAPGGAPRPPPPSKNPQQSPIPRPKAPKTVPPAAPADGRVELKTPPGTPKAAVTKRPPGPAPSRPTTTAPAPSAPTAKPKQAPRPPQPSADPTPTPAPPQPPPQDPPKTLVERFREGKEAERAAKSREAAKAAGDFGQAVKSTEADPVKVRRAVEAKLNVTWTKARDTKIDDYAAPPKGKDTGGDVAPPPPPPPSEPSAAAPVAKGTARPNSSRADPKTPPAPKTRPPGAPKGKTPTTKAPPPGQPLPAVPAPDPSPEEGGSGDRPKKSCMNENIRFVSSFMKARTEVRAALSEKPPDAFGEMLVRFALQVVRGAESLDIHMEEPIARWSTPDFYVATIAWRFRSIMSDATLKGHPQLAKLVKLTKGATEITCEPIDPDDEAKGMVVTMTYETEDGGKRTEESHTESCYKTYWETLIFIKEYLVRLHAALVENMQGIRPKPAEDDGVSPEDREIKMARSMCLGASGFVARQWTMFRTLITLNLFSGADTGGSASSAHTKP